MFERALNVLFRVLKLQNLKDFRGFVPDPGLLAIIFCASLGGAPPSQIVAKWLSHKCFHRIAGDQSDYKEEGFGKSVLNEAVSLSFSGVISRSETILLKFSTRISHPL